MPAIFARALGLMEEKQPGGISGGKQVITFAVTSNRG